MAERLMKLKPWLVPNFVQQEMPSGRREDGIRTAPSWPLHELGPEELAQLCDDFRAEVFRKAGKPDPLDACALCGTSRDVHVCAQCSRSMEPTD